MTRGKKINGRKRHAVVDTCGHLLALCVHGAEIQDGDGADLVLERLRGRFPRLAHLWGDRRYGGELVGWVHEEFGWTLEIVRKPPEQVGFQVQHWRWVVERTFAWWGRYRRLSKDYEHHTAHSESMIYLAEIHRTVRRLAQAA
jgi:putative transposase